MARIAGINIPLNKRAEIGLTYVFGIGRSTANQILKETGVDPNTAVKDLTEDEIIKLRDLEHVSSIVVTHQLRDAFYVATHMAERDADGRVRIVPASREKEREAEFIMIREGLIVFEGDADALRASTDPYIQTFLD